MTDTEARPGHHPPAPPRPRWASRRAAMTAGLILGGVAAGAGATALALGTRQVQLVALTPVAVTALQPQTAAAIKGDVAELFGGKFILQDATGRALVETGPRGDKSPVVKAGETVTVQGRFDHGSLHAQAVTHADGRVDMLGPQGPGGPPPAPPPPGEPLRAGPPADRS